MGEARRKHAQSASKRASTIDAAKNNVTDQGRSAHIKSLVAERLKEEDIRNKLVADEIVKMKRHGPRASSA